jgi:hypothetical protein
MSVMRSWLLPSILVSTLSVNAGAQGTERVTLADGTVMQGELVEKVPGNHITLKLATGEVRTIQWSALAPQVAPPTPLVPQVSQPMVHVVVEGDRPGVAFIRILGYGMVEAYTGYGTAIGAFEQSRPVCIAPCQADVEAGGMYRIGGDGVTPTGTFGLPMQQGALHLRVHAGSLGARVGGVWLLIGGISIGVAGGTFAAIAAADSSVSSNPGLLVTGLVLTAVGVVGIVVGAILLAGSGTSVVSDSGMTLARQRSSHPRLTLSGVAF